MGIFRSILNAVFARRGDSRRDDVGVLAQCTADYPALDGYYTKLLAAYARLLGMEYRVRRFKTHLGLGIEAALTVKTQYWESAVDVFERGRVACISNLMEYAYNAGRDFVETSSRKMLGEALGENKYIRAMKGGMGYVVAKPGILAKNPDFTVDRLPASEEELLLRLAAAGIVPDEMVLRIEEDDGEAYP